MVASELDLIPLLYKCMPASAGWKREEEKNMLMATRVLYIESIEVRRGLQVYSIFSENIRKF